MEFQAVQYTVDKLVQWIRSGRLALPDFQREFVWNPARVVELLDSVARQWPIGSLLLLSGPQPFGVRPINDAPDILGSELDYYVLDGQQRLTSLYHAISDVSEFCYFVDFNAVSTDQEDYVRWEKRGSFLAKYPTARVRAMNGIALVKEIWEFDLFYEWIEQVDPSVQKTYVALRERKLGGLQPRVYKVMAIELDQSIQLEALARIFETLNRTGVKLNAFDLMVALLYPTGFHLRDAWENAVNQYDSLERYQIDPVEVLKLIALLIRGDSGSRASRGVRQGNLLELNRDLIVSKWSNAVELYVQAIDYGCKHFGLFCAEAIPAPSMVLGLAYLLSVGGNDQLIARWFWASGFGQSYAQAANTVVVADTDAIRAGTTNDLLLGRARDVSSVLSDSARRNGMALRTLSCLIAKSGGVDIFSGSPLVDQTSMAFLVFDNGLFRKLNAKDNFLSVVVVSKESEKKWAGGRRASLWSDLAANEQRHRLESQFFEPITLQRTVDSLCHVIRQAIGEDL